MKTMVNPHNTKLQAALRDAMGPGFQFAGPAEALLSATAGPRATRPADPVRR